jgi:hypothetical protein
MTVSEVAALEQVSTRMIQRYVSEGYKGNKLPAVRVGKSFVIAENDYKRWRIACDFAQPEPIPEPGGGSPQGRTPSQVEVIAPPAPTYPPWPLAADPNGPITNAPHEHSSNFPHPEACRIYMEEQLRKQQIQIRGEDEN